MTRVSAGVTVARAGRSTSGYRTVRCERWSEAASRGDLCYTVCVDGYLAHYSWVQRSGSHPSQRPGCLCLLEAVSSGFTTSEQWSAPEEENLTCNLERIVNDHFEEGYCTAFIYTSRENIAAQKGILRAGFGLVATLGALRVGSHYYRTGHANQGQ